MASFAGAVDHSTDFSDDPTMTIASSSSMEAAVLAAVAAAGSYSGSFDATVPAPSSSASGSSYREVSELPTTSASTTSSVASASAQPRPGALRSLLPASISALSANNRPGAVPVPLPKGTVLSRVRAFEAIMSEEAAAAAASAAAAAYLSRDGGSDRRPSQGEQSLLAEVMKANSDFQTLLSKPDVIPASSSSDVGGGVIAFSEYSTDAAILPGNQADDLRPLTPPVASIVPSEVRPPSISEDSITSGPPPDNLMLPSASPLGLQSPLATVPIPVVPRSLPPFATSSTVLKKKQDQDSNAKHFASTAESNPTVAAPATLVSEGNDRGSPRSVAAVASSSLDDSTLASLEAQIQQLQILRSRPSMVAYNHSQPTRTPPAVTKPMQSPQIDQDYAAPAVNELGFKLSDNQEYAQPSQQEDQKFIQQDYIVTAAQQYAPPEQQLEIQQQFDVGVNVQFGAKQSLDRQLEELQLQQRQNLEHMQQLEQLQLLQQNQQFEGMRNDQLLQLEQQQQFNQMQQMEESQMQFIAQQQANMQFEQSQVLGDFYVGNGGGFSGEALASFTPQTANNLPSPTSSSAGESSGAQFARKKSTAQLVDGPTLQSLAQSALFQGPLLKKRDNAGGKLFGRWRKQLAVSNHLNDQAHTSFPLTRETTVRDVGKNTLELVSPQTAGSVSKRSVTWNVQFDNASDVQAWVESLRRVISELANPGTPQQGFMPPNMPVAGLQGPFPTPPGLGPAQFSVEQGHMGLLPGGVLGPSGFEGSSPLSIRDATAILQQQIQPQFPNQMQMQQQQQHLLPVPGLDLVQNGGVDPNGQFNQYGAVTPLRMDSGPAYLNNEMVYNAPVVGDVKRAMSMPVGQQQDQMGGPIQKYPSVIPSQSMPLPAPTQPLPPTPQLQQNSAMQGQGGHLRVSTSMGMAGSNGVGMVPPLPQAVASNGQPLMQLQLQQHAQQLHLFPQNPEDERARARAAVIQQNGWGAPTASTTAADTRGSLPRPSPLGAGVPRAYGTADLLRTRTGNVGVAGMMPARSLSPQSMNSTYSLPGAAAGPPVGVGGFGGPANGWDALHLAGLRSRSQSVAAVGGGNYGRSPTTAGWPQSPQQQQPPGTALAFGGGPPAPAAVGAWGAGPAPPSPAIAATVARLAAGAATVASSPRYIDEYAGVNPAAAAAGPGVPFMPAARAPAAVHVRGLAGSRSGSPAAFAQSHGAYGPQY
ncbi:hypothetical protein HK405_004440 [Cladochytrium tenue]|nr:hypothetical protein HK405_004440 [Cladochytrium tenue]